MENLGNKMDDLEDKFLELIKNSALEYFNRTLANENNAPVYKNSLLTHAEFKMYCGQAQITVFQIPDSFTQQMLLKGGSRSKRGKQRGGASPQTIEKCLHFMFTTVMAITLYYMLVYKIDVTICDQLSYRLIGRLFSSPLQNQYCLYYRYAIEAILKQIKLLENSKTFTEFTLVASSTGAVGIATFTTFMAVFSSYTQVIRATANYLGKKDQTLPPPLVVATDTTDTTDAVVVAVANTAAAANAIGDDATGDDATAAAIGDATATNRSALRNARQAMAIAIGDMSDHLATIFSPSQGGSRKCKPKPVPAPRKKPLKPR